jgi:hypothetical protein
VLFRSVDIVDKTINKFGYPWNEAVANQGKGVFESLKIMGKIVIDSLNKKYSRPAYGQPPVQPAAAPQAQRAVPASSPSSHPFSASVRQQPPKAAPDRYPPQQDIFQNPSPAPSVRPAPQPAFRQPPVPPAQRQPEPMRQDYYEYGSINLEPMSQPSVKQAPQQPSAPQSQDPSSMEKTELDLEIEKYQREIEDKQKRLKSLQSGQQSSPQPPAQPVQQQPQQSQQFPAPQSGSYDVYQPPESSEEQYAQFPQRQADADQPASQDDDQQMYFTSINTDRQHKKIKRPINPKTRNQSGFLGKLFNKDKQQ